MHCGTCYKKFSLMRTRKQCSECRRYYCKYCVMRKANKHINCENCAVLTSRPLNKTQLLKLKAKDLQVYLANKQVSTKGCIEKEDLVNLLLAHANGTTETPTETNYSDDQTNPTRQLFKNLRSFFTSTSDVSSNSRPEANNPTTAAGARVQFHARPPYYNPPPPNLETTTETTPSTQNVDVPLLNVAVVSSAEEARSGSGDDVSNAESSSIILPSLITDTPSQQLPHEGPQNNSESETDSDIIVTTISNNSNLTASERDISNSNESFHNLQLSDIKNQQALHDLTIQQLKCLLIKNRVDFKGCVEKAELLERVQRLWNEYYQSREGLETLPIDDLCKICMDAPIECVMLECGHMATCTLCGKQLSECPICRQYVVRVVRTFRA
ncbi:E3 ubiquitin-protein ligase RNF34 [Chrysoperla carnea]|uniref:E3 ubiquitin-protein ligase RNF34 n=1 Tax=Chrysoperla carnea TaxID=189513 RepID=UPI001D08EB29|nr:E3 ubiquitin-protein ligase RNF34 [Chrysoperla carnea]